MNSKEVQDLLQDEFLMLWRLKKMSYNKLIELKHIGDEVHHKMHAIDQQGAYYDIGMTPEQLKYEHDILVANLDKVDAAIRHHEKFDVLYFGERPMFYHAN